MIPEDHDAEACARLARPCLPCKLRLWRSGSNALAVAIPEGWRGPSVQALERRQVEMAAAAGIPIDRPPT